MILQRRFWSISIMFVLLFEAGVWFVGDRLHVGPVTISLCLALIVATAICQLILFQLVFMRPLRRRLQRIDDLIRTVDPSPSVPRARGTDELEQIRSDLRRALHRLEETRGDLAVRRIRAEVDSRTDPLTKLYNHRSFVHFLAEEWERAQRARAPLALLILDVDHFKAFNDEYGHLVGNQVLERVATTIRESVRGSDLVFRYAGDEFAVILPRTGLEQAVGVAEKIRARVNEVKMIEAGGRQLSLSIGAAEIWAELRTPEELVQLADKALYRSKEAGRNVVTYPIGRASFRIYRSGDEN